MRVAAVLLPFARRTPHAFHDAERSRVFFEPFLQQPPLPQQRFVRRLDGQFAGVVRHVGGDEALFDKLPDQRQRFRRDFGDTGDATARASGIRIDAGQPRDQAAAQQRQARLAVARNARIIVGRAKGAFGSGLDRPLDAAEGVVVT